MADFPGKEELLKEAKQKDIQNEYTLLAINSKQQKLNRIALADAGVISIPATIWTVKALYAAVALAASWAIGRKIIDNNQVFTNNGVDFFSQSEIQWRDPVVVETPVVETPVVETPKKRQLPISQLQAAVPLIIGFDYIKSPKRKVQIQYIMENYKDHPIIAKALTTPSRVPMIDSLL